MKIQQEQLYHGAAIIQVVEQPSFTAINRLSISGITYQKAYLVNADRALYVKYAATRNANLEHAFTFRPEHLKELEQIFGAHPKTFVVLVCGEDQEICCLKYDEFRSLRDFRLSHPGNTSSTLTMVVKILAGKMLRVGVNIPGTKNKWHAIKVARNSYPSSLFE